jgi:hypothetical protein
VGLGMKQYFDLGMKRHSDLGMKPNFGLGMMVDSDLKWYWDTLRSCIPKHMKSRTRMSWNFPVRDMNVEERRFLPDMGSILRMDSQPMPRTGLLAGGSKSRFLL